MVDMTIRDRILASQLAAKYREQYPRRTAMLNELRNF